MTITTLPTRNEYTATAGQTVFTYTFKIFESTDLNVYQTPAGQKADDTADLITGYTVSGIGDEDGGAITLTSPASSGDLITIVSDIPESRTTDYQNNGDFRPDVVNDDFDRVVSLVKQVNDNIASRTLSFQESQQGGSGLSLPSPDAGRLLRWKGDETGLENVDVATPVEVSFNSVGSLRAFSDSDTLASGTVVNVTGYYSNGDGGGGQFYWDAASVLADDSGTVIKVTSITTGRWIRSDLINGNVLFFGAKGDGVTDDTTAINTCLSVYNNTLFPTGTYMVDAHTGTIPELGIRPQSNSRLTFEPGATLQAITNSDTTYRVLHINSVDSVEIIGGVFSGDKDTHTGSTGEAGHAIYITGSTNITINSAQGNNGWGVGIAILASENVWVNDCSFDNNRQNGGALISGKNIYFKDPVFSNTSGTAPAAGFDIEPNSNTDYFENINFSGVKTINNEGVGFSIALAQLAEGTEDVSIYINDLVDVGSNYGLYVNKIEESTTSRGPSGKIVIKDPVLQESNLGGIYIQSYAAATTPTIEIIRPKVLNCNVANNASGLFGSGIIALRQSAETTTYTLGNFNITNPSVIDNRTTPQMVYAIYCQDAKGTYFDKTAKVIDPIELSGTATSGINYLFFANDGVQVSDRYNTISTEINSTTSLIGRIYTEITNTGAALVTVNLNTNITDNLITFKSRTVNGLRLDPDVALRIRPLSSTGGKYIETYENGASITLKRIDSVSYVVENIVGTWAVET